MEQVFTGNSDIGDTVHNSLMSDVEVNSQLTEKDGAYKFGGTQLYDYQATSTIGFTDDFDSFMFSCSNANSSVSQRISVAGIY